MTRWENKVKLLLATAFSLMVSPVLLSVAKIAANASINQAFTDSFLY
ncbi:hypothetical protein ACIQZI_12370 [Peribacillus sp. NPDC096379]